MSRIVTHSRKPIWLMSLHCLRPIIILLCGLIICPPAKSFDDAAASDQVGKETESLIEALANRNPVPELSRGRAVFPPNYDWREERRVQRAFIALADKPSVEKWEILVRHTGDKRHSLAIGLGGDLQQTANYSVGDVCFLVASNQLLEVARRDLRILRPGSPGNISMRWTSLADWRKQRAQKTLWELQVEVCERALQKVSSADEVSDENRKKARNALEADIAKLQASKQPVFYKFPHDSHVLYNEKRATRRLVDVPADCE